MHAGARVLRLCKGASASGSWRFEVIAKFTEHGSMNYGSDVQPVIGSAGAEKARERMVVSTSFYDKLLCVWRFDMDANAEEPPAAAAVDGGGAES